MILFSLLFFLFLVEWPDQSSPRAVLSPGEEFQYSVRWGLIRLGTIRTKAVLESEVQRGLWKVTVLVESNPALAFIEINEFHHSTFDLPNRRSLFYAGVHRNEDEVLETRYVIDTTHQQVTVHYRDRIREEIIGVDTLSLEPFAVDGTSLFYLARVLTLQNGVHEVPTLIDGRYVNTLFCVDRGELVDPEIAEEVLTIRVWGELGARSGTAAQLEGAFEGWFTNDEAAVLLRGEVKTFLGPVTIELESWKREGWNPPE